jgi:hypothetical protein
MGLFVLILAFLGGFSQSNGSATRPPIPVPESVVMCTAFEADDSSKSAHCKNLGSKVITAFVYRDVDNPLLVGWVDVASPGLQSGKTYPVVVPPSSPLDRLQIDAVIFADGTHTGSSPDPARNNEDVVEEIFEWRQAQAQAWAEWRQQIVALPADDSKAIQAFLESVSGLQDTGPATSIEQAGRDKVVDELIRQARSIKDALEKITAYRTSGNTAEVVLTPKEIRESLIDNWVIKRSEVAHARSLNAGESR